VGVSPKHFLRTVRLRAALSLQLDSLAEAAARAGYADQAHLCRESRELAGMTAGALRSELRGEMSDSSKPSTTGSLKLEP
jgi:AraC-like DNA-binding protein